MEKYNLTVFHQDGETLYDQTFEATTIAEAKKIGTNLLEENGYEAYTHRCVTPDGKLILFHR